MVSGLGWAGELRAVVFDGVRSEQRWTLKELNPEWPSDWSAYNYLVLEMRASSPQRFSLWIYTAGGPRRIMLQPFGQGVWLRAAVPLRYFKGRDQEGRDLASTNNRRTNSFWMSVWGPFGDLTKVEALGVTMWYPVGKPTLEIRSIQLSKDDPGSDFLEKTPVVDEFGQWVYADWPRKLRSREQLDKEIAEEKSSLIPGGFGYCGYGGYKRLPLARATGFFRVEVVDGKWWFVDPHGHLFLSVGSNGLRRAAAERGAADPGAGLLVQRLDAWGLNTAAQGQGKPYVVQLDFLMRLKTTYLGLPDVYSKDFERGAESLAAGECAANSLDAMLIGYFIGNEPPWPGRENEVVDMILAGPDTDIKQKAREFLAEGDTLERRKQFVLSAFERQLEVIDAALRRHDPYHLNLGIRFGGNPPEEVLRAGRVFDVCSINVYEYEPKKQIERAYKITGRPILIGEFHFGAPGNGLGAGLVQTRDQVERGKAYRYYVEQAATEPGFVGAHWFTWKDEPALGRFDGENYNIGLVDVTNRPYVELVEAAKATHRRLGRVHSGQEAPFAEKPLASDAGAPETPWVE